MSLAKIEGDEIVIRVPLSALPHAAEVAWDEAFGFEQHRLFVENVDEFAKEFVHYLNDEDEQGNTIVHFALDKAAVLVVDRGCGDGVGEHPKETEECD